MSTADIKIPKVTLGNLLSIASTTVLCAGLYYGLSGKIALIEQSANYDRLSDASARSEIRATFTREVQVSQERLISALSDVTKRVDNLELFQRDTRQILTSIESLKTEVRYQSDSLKEIKADVRQIKDKP